MNTIYITLGAGKIQNCYSDTEIKVVIIDLDAQTDIDYANNDEMLTRLDNDELTDITPFE